MRPAGAKKTAHCVPAACTGQHPSFVWARPPVNDHRPRVDQPACRPSRSMKRLRDWSPAAPRTLSRSQRQRWRRPSRRRRAGTSSSARQSRRRPPPALRLPSVRWARLPKKNLPQHFRFQLVTMSENRGPCLGSRSVRLGSQVWGPILGEFALAGSRSWPPTGSAGLGMAPCPYSAGPRRSLRTNGTNSPEGHPRARDLFCLSIMGFN